MSISTAVASLKEHLSRITGDPHLAFDDALFDDWRLKVDDDNRRYLTDELLPLLIAVVRSTEVEPKPGTSLIADLIAPWTFNDVLTFGIESDEVVQALRSGWEGPQWLAWAIMEKASWDVSATSTLAANHADMFKKAFDTWLRTPHYGPADKGTHVVAKILAMDCPSKPARLNGYHAEQPDDTPGTGALWDILCDDDSDLSRDVEALIRLDQSHLPPSEQRSRDQVSTSQARLLDLYGRICPLEPLRVLRSRLFASAYREVDLTDPVDRRIWKLFWEGLVVAMEQSEKRSPEGDEEFKMALDRACQRDAEVESADPLRKDLERVPNTADVPPERIEALTEWVRYLLSPGDAMEE